MESGFFSPCKIGGKRGKPSAFQAPRGWKGNPALPGALRPARALAGAILPAVDPGPARARRGRAAGTGAGVDRRGRGSGEHVDPDRRGTGAGSGAGAFGPRSALPGAGAGSAFLPLSPPPPKKHA